MNKIITSHVNYRRLDASIAFDTSLGTFTAEPQNPHFVQGPWVIHLMSEDPPQRHPICALESRRLELLTESSTLPLRAYLSNPGSHALVSVAQQNLTIDPGAFFVLANQGQEASLLVYFRRDEIGWLNCYEQTPAFLGKGHEVRVTDTTISINGHTFFQITLERLIITPQDKAALTTFFLADPKETKERKIDRTITISTSRLPNKVFILRSPTGEYLAFSIYNGQFQFQRF